MCTVERGRSVPEVVDPLPSRKGKLLAKKYAKGEVLGFTRAPNYQRISMQQDGAG